MNGMRLIGIAIVWAAVTTSVVTAQEDPGQLLGRFYEAGKAHYDQGRYAAALPNFEQAVKLGPRVFGRGQRGEIAVDTARLMEFQARCLQELMRFAEAEPLFNACSQAAKVENDLEMHLRCEGNLANLYADLHQFEAAKEKYENVIKAVTSPLERGRNQSNLGFLFLEQDRFREAAENFDASSRNLNGADRLLEAINDHGRGMIAFRQGRYDDAERSFARALDVRTRDLPADHRFTAYSRGMLASVYAYRGRDTESRGMFEQALASLRRFWGDNHFDVAMELHELGLLLERTGRVNEAAARFDESRRILKAHTQRQLTILSIAEQAKFLTEERSRFMDVLALAVKHRDNAEFVRRAFEWTVNNKGLAQQALAEQEVLLRQGQTGSPRMRELIVGLKDVRAQATAAASSGAGADAATTARLANRESELLREIGGQNQAPRAWLETRQIAAALPPDGVLVEIVRLDRDRPVKSQFDARPTRARDQERYAAFTLDRSETPRLIDLGPASEIDAHVAAVRKRLESFSAERQTLGDLAAFERLKTPLQALRQRVWEPFAGTISAERPLILSPDGALWLLPWCALPTDDSGEKLLLERHAIRLTVSGGDLLRRKDPTPASGAVIFADPLFRATAQEKQAALKSLDLRNVSLSAATRSVTFRGAFANVTPLPATAAEAEEVYRLMQRFVIDREPQKLTAAKALETSAKRIVRPRVAHFATHGFFLSSEQVGNVPAFKNPLLRCGLLFSGCSDPNAMLGDDDGVLTGLEVCGLDLRGTELVMLSACETGVGQVTDGEGVAGLRQAFQLAGAEAVVSSLWTVPDVDTSLLMVDFFEQVAKGKSKSEALRIAQRNRISKRNAKEGVAHPFYWAAWTVTGN